MKIFERAYFRSILFNNTVWFSGVEPVRSIWRDPAWWADMSQLLECFGTGKEGGGGLPKNFYSAKS